MMDKNIVVVMPAYNAARTLKQTWDDLPHEIISSIILVDDGSTDDTIRIAKQLGLIVFQHDRNYGYGANQKTCYAEAIKTDANIVVMVHPDYQYDPKLLPNLIQPILDGEADVVLGSRMMGVSAFQQGMPWWKYIANKFLTRLENMVFKLNLSEYHTGYRAYDRKVLEQINFRANSDDFIFDQEIIAQIVEAHVSIIDIPVPVRYFPEASSANFFQSMKYGMEILGLLVRYLMHKTHLRRSRQFEVFDKRYTKA